MRALPQVRQRDRQSTLELPPCLWADDGRRTCSALFNASVAVYNPYTAQTVELIEFPGLTGRADLHASGLTWDQRTGLLSIIMNSPNPFITGGQDVSGDNFLIKYDPSLHRALWTVNLTATSRGAYGGFQEV